MIVVRTLNGSSINSLKMPVRMILATSFVLSMTRLW